MDPLVEMAGITANRYVQQNRIPTNYQIGDCSVGVI
jgi:hypothetical protein